ncbi:MAG: AtpZ/AtpI family protein [Lachnospiraceae bacterium]|nr:AtpZ/AtpI family protein [Lachnospiraceae bacterium]
MKYRKNVFRSLTLITQFGIYMIVPILLCTFLGMFLDRKLSTSFLVIVFFFLGALAGFTNVFRLARSIYTRSDEKHINYYETEGTDKQDDDREDTAGQQNA